MAEEHNTAKTKDVDDFTYTRCSVESEGELAIDDHSFVDSAGD